MTAKATGYVRTIDRKGGPVFYAKLKLPDGTQPQRRLGKVWTKRTRPPAGCLTRGMAEARLEAILAGDDPLVNVAPSNVTFTAACDEHLRYLEHDRQCKRSTIRDARSTIKVHLLPAFGEDTPVENITTADVDTLRESLLGGKLSHRTAQKTLTLLHGILARAKRKGWVAENVAENAERVTLRRSDEFNVLTVEQVHAVARAAADLGALIRVAAFTGLRQGELLALRGGTSTSPIGSCTFGATCRPARSKRTRRSRTASAAFRCPTRRRSRSTRSAGASTSPARTISCSATWSAGTCSTTSSATRSTTRSTRPSWGTCASGTTRSSSTTCGTRSGRSRSGNAPVTDVQHWMGHADIQATMRYVHYVPQEDNAARLSAAFASNAGPSETAIEAPVPTSTF